MPVTVSGLALTLLVGCTTEPDRSEAAPPPPASETPVPDSNEALIAVARKAEDVVVATVTAVGPRPGGWSGFGAAYQTVTYKVDTVLKGQSIEVRHTVVRGAPSADSTTPGLNAEMFAPGKQLILSLKHVATGLASAHERYGAVPRSDELQEAITKALATP
jgi:hypothetical protein